MHGETVKFIWL